MGRTRWSVALTAMTLALTAGALGGCTSGGTSGTSSGSPIPTRTIATQTRDPKLAALVPAAVAADGKLTFATDAAFPPNEFPGPDGRLVGMDIDLGTAVAQKLGLTADFRNSPFPTIIPGVAAGRLEAGLSSFSINNPRLEQVDMISYFVAGTSLGVKAGNPDGLRIDNLCGTRLGVLTGTVQADDARKRNAECTALSRPPVVVLELPNDLEMTKALTDGRIQGILADSPVVGYTARNTNGAVVPSGQVFDTQPYGIVIAKHQAQFATALQGALQQLIEEGTYRTILVRWNVQDGAITHSDVQS